MSQKDILDIAREAGLRTHLHCAKDSRVILQRFIDAVHADRFPTHINPGETYIGLIGDASGSQHHVILLPEDSDPASWAEQMAWAKSIGGDLPTRIEQAMLWDSHRDQFQGGWYWSCDENSSVFSWVWYQNFNTGGQSYEQNGTKLRARSVRRVPA